MSNHTFSLLSDTVQVKNRTIFLLKLSVNMHDEPPREKYTEETLQITWFCLESQNKMEMLFFLILLGRCCS